MSRSLRFDAAAERELDEAVDFYDLESPGLGDVLLAEVEPRSPRSRRSQKRRSRSATGSAGASCAPSPTRCSTRCARTRSASSRSPTSGAGRSTGRGAGECG